MTSLPGSSLEPTEDSRFSILSTQDVKRLLKGIEDNTHLLKEIEDNTHPDRSNRSVSRHNRREKVIVEIRTTIISVGDIDTVGQQFKCDFYLSATWQEPQLQGRSPTEEIKWHNEWHPMIVFFNAVEIGRMEKNHYLFYELGNEIPLVVETCRIKGTFRGNLNLLDFPLDYQQLTITLMSEWTNKLVEFRKNLRKADTIRSETFTADQEWYLCEHVVTEAKITKKTKGSSENDYPLYDIKCHVKRKSGYYLWNSAMIIFLIYMLSFCSFSVEISSPSDRLSVTLTLLLTAVAFKFVVLQSLPTISYLTLLDKYVLSGLVFLSCMAIENAVAASILDPDTQKRFDRICLYFGIGCFLFIHILAVAFVIKKLRTRNKKLADSEEHFKEMRQRVKELERKGSRSNNNNNKNQHRSKEDLPQYL